MFPLFLRLVSCLLVLAALNLPVVGCAEQNVTALPHCSTLAYRWSIQGCYHPWLCITGWNFGPSPCTYHLPEMSHFIFFFFVFFPLNALHDFSLLQQSNEMWISHAVFHLLVTDLWIWILLFVLIRLAFWCDVKQSRLLAVRQSRSWYFILIHCRKTFTSEGHKKNFLLCFPPSCGWQPLKVKFTVEGNSYVWFLPAGEHVWFG